MKKNDFLTKGLICLSAILFICASAITISFISLPRAVITDEIREATAMNATVMTASSSANLEILSAEIFENDEFFVVKKENRVMGISKNSFSKSSKVWYNKDRQKRGTVS